MHDNSEKYLTYIETLTKVGIALSVEKDQNHLLEMILTSAMHLTNADGGTLYLLKEKKELSFEIFANKSLKILPMRITEQIFPIKSIPLYFENGQPNNNNIASYCVLHDQTINIVDAYQAEGFDFSGVKEADKRFDYRSKSFLTIPLRNHENNVIGVLQLINAMEEKTKAIIAFTKEKIFLAESLASQAAVALTIQQLIQSQKNLLEAVLQLIAKAIDQKCKYTSNHCTRVPIITMMIADALNAATNEKFKNISLNKDQLEELRIAAWLHDCGKITTPEYVINKSTKLETLHDRIDNIKLRFEIAKLQTKITLLEKELKTQDGFSQSLVTDIKHAESELDQDLQFLIHANQGSEYLSRVDEEKIVNFANKSFHWNGMQHPLLTQEEIMNLCIRRGTLNDTEREMIKNHVRVTQMMLESLPYPKYLNHVPEIAGNHHERMDGKGYPRGLKGHEMSIQSRIVAIADIFESLTASDRPYRNPNTISGAILLMTTMANEGHIDPDLFDLFVKEKVYLKYARQYLKPEQIDL